MAVCRVSEQSVFLPQAERAAAQEQRLAQVRTRRHLWSVRPVRVAADRSTSTEGLAGRPVRLEPTAPQLVVAVVAVRLAPAVQLLLVSLVLQIRRPAAAVARRVTAQQGVWEVRARALLLQTSPRQLRARSVREAVRAVQRAHQMAYRAVRAGVQAAAAAAAVPVNRRQALLPVWVAQAAQVVF